MENNFFNKVIELTVKGFVNNGNYDVLHTKMLINDLRQFVRLYEGIDELNEKKERKPRKSKNNETENISNPTA